MYEEKADRSKWVVRGLVIAVLILLILVVYAFIIAPSINAYVVQKQLEVKDYVLNTMLSQIEKQGYTEIINGNESIILVPYIPQNAGSDSGLN
jgi:hypothetical protein